MNRPAIQTTTLPPITREAVANFGDAVGDHNPVHFDKAFANAAGLPDTVVHGPLITALILDQLIAQLGADNILNMDMRLRDPVFPGDQLTMSAISYGEEDYGVAVHSQRGERVATVTIVLAGGPDA